MAGTPGLLPESQVYLHARIESERTVSYKMYNEHITICIACSPGGHLVQAQRLMSLYTRYEHFYLTFESPVVENLRATERVRTVPNLQRHDPVSWIRSALASFRVAWQERPDVVICTGAGVTVFVCVFCKLLGARLVFIESLAKIERPTTTARLLYPLADLFIVQWPRLLSFFPKAKCYGRCI